MHVCTVALIHPAKYLVPHPGNQLTYCSEEQVDLVAEGVDTVADIYLNDHFVAQTQNAHR